MLLNFKTYNNIENKNKTRNEKVKSHNKNKINEIGSTTEEKTKNIDSIRKFQSIDDESDNYDNMLKSKINNQYQKGTFILNNNNSPNININKALAISIFGKTNSNNKKALKKILINKSNTIKIFAIQKKRLSRFIKN